MSKMRYEMSVQSPVKGQHFDTQETVGRFVGVISNVNDLSDEEIFALFKPALSALRTSALPFFDESQS